MANLLHRIALNLQLNNLSSGEFQEKHFKLQLFLSSLACENGKHLLRAWPGMGKVNSPIHRQISCLTHWRLVLVRWERPLVPQQPSMLSEITAETGVADIPLFEHS